MTSFTPSCGDRLFVNAATAGKVKRDAIFDCSEAQKELSDNAGVVELIRDVRSDVIYASQIPLPAF